MYDQRIVSSGDVMQLGVSVIIHYNSLLAG